VVSSLATINLAQSASKFSAGSVIRVVGLGAPFDGSHVVTAATATSVSFSVSSANISLTTDNNGYVTFGYPEYEIGEPIPENASLDTNYNPVLVAAIDNYVEGYHNFEMQAGVGPQSVIAVRFTFRGDVKIDGVNVWFTGTYNLRGEA
jgi:hypothetical protein